MEENMKKTGAEFRTDSQPPSLAISINILKTTSHVVIGSLEKFFYRLVN